MVENLVDMVISVLNKLGYFGIFIFMALESACIPIPSDAILPFGGYLSYIGKVITYRKNFYFSSSRNK